MRPLALGKTEAHLGRAHLAQAHVLHLAAVVDEHAAELGEPPARPLGPESNAALASVSASSAVGPIAVTPTRPVQAGSPVAGIEQVVGEARRRASRQIRTLMPGGRHAAAGEPQRDHARAASAGARPRSGRAPPARPGRRRACRRRSRRRSARIRASRLCRHVGGQPLAGAAAVEADAGRTLDRAGLRRRPGSCASAPPELVPAGRATRSRSDRLRRQRPASTPSRESPYPACSSSPTRVGSTRPPVRSAAQTAARTASLTRLEAGTTRRGSRFRPDSSLSGLKRERRASKSSRKQRTVRGRGLGAQQPGLERLADQELASRFPCSESSSRTRGRRVMTSS